LLLLLFKDLPETAKEAAPVADTGLDAPIVL